MFAYIDEATSYRAYTLCQMLAADVERHSFSVAAAAAAAAGASLLHYSKWYARHFQHENYIDVHLLLGALARKCHLIASKMHVSCWSHTSRQSLSSHCHSTRSFLWLHLSFCICARFFLFSQFLIFIFLSLRFANMRRSSRCGWCLFCDFVAMTHCI